MPVGESSEIDGGNSPVISYSDHADHVGSRVVETCPCLDDGRGEDHRRCRADDLPAGLILRPRTARRRSVICDGVPAPLDDRKLAVLGLSEYYAELPTQLSRRAFDPGIVVQCHERGIGVSEVLAFEMFDRGHSDPARHLFAVPSRSSFAFGDLGVVLRRVSQANGNCFGVHGGAGGRGVVRRRLARGHGTVRSGGDGAAHGRCGRRRSDDRGHRRLRQQRCRLIDRRRHLTRVRGCELPIVLPEGDGDVEKGGEQRDEADPVLHGESPG